MEKLKWILHRLWLSNQEIELYIILLQWWRQSTTTIAKKLNKPRTTLYTHINSLSQKWLIQIEQEPRWQRFNILDFKNLVVSIEQQKKVFDESIQELNNIEDEYNTIQNKNNFIPKIKIHETKESRNIIYKNIQQFKETYCISNYNMTKKFPQRHNKRKQQFNHTSTNNIIYEIVIDNIEGNKYQKKCKNPNHQIKILKWEKNIKADIMLVDGVYYHTSLWGERIVMFEINDSNFYETQKSLFINLWNQLS